VDVNKVAMATNVKKKEKKTGATSYSARKKG
jgi:hypothetical protein